MAAFAIRAESRQAFRVIRMGDGTLAELAEAVIDAFHLPQAWPYELETEKGVFSSEGFGRKEPAANSVRLSEVLKPKTEMTLLIDNGDDLQVKMQCAAVLPEECEVPVVTEKNGKIQILPPEGMEELPDWLQTWDSDKVTAAYAQLEMTPETLRLMTSFCLALVNFYLVLPEKTAWEMFNAMLPKTASEEQFAAFLRVASHDSGFCYLVPEEDGCWLADPDVYDFEEDYEEMLELADSMEWYRPTADELAPYARNEMQDTPAFAKLRAYLIQRGCDPEEMANGLAESIIAEGSLMGGDPDDVYPAQYEDAAAPEVLRVLYEDAVNSFRTPLLHGFTRMEAGQPYKLRIKKQNDVLWKPRK